MRDDIARVRAALKDALVDNVLMEFAIDNQTKCTACDNVAPLVCEKCTLCRRP